MKAEFVILLGLLFSATVRCDVRHSRPLKMCEEGPSQVSGGSLDQMIGSVENPQISGNQHQKPIFYSLRQQFPCNVEQSSQQRDESDEEVTSEQSPPPFYSPDTRYDPKRSQEIALSVLDLSQRLVENIVSKSSKKFEILSPISIASALQLALLGAHGMTFSELMDL
jgi:hypothetical protein